ncbi:hypothetical protein C0993_002928, partial [Termitomyces sp. T159_Od127]
MILGFTWLWEHNPEVDWAQGKVAMSRCPWRCSTYAAEVKEERRASVREHAAIQACRAGHFLFADLDLLDPPLLAFPCREALYKDDPPLLAFPRREALYEDDQSSGRAPEDELGGEFHGIHHPELPDEVVEVGDWIYATTLHPPLPIKEIHASQTTSQRLAQAFATNSPPRAFRDAVP